ncbi:MAG TPA: peptidyl-prolyl cis-trans isomerase [Polyangiaceae bacterium]|jgi:peptidyl-prolyl cis-trans isomerase C|nr:peptidyl-prolyl cis-trans isomerase [Polyangiaceae bacterium]
MPSSRTVSFVLALSASVATSALAADSPAIITVGTATMSQDAVSRRLAALPAYQLSKYGKTPSEQKKAFVEQVLVPEMLFGEEGKARKLDQSPALAQKLRESLRDATDRAVRADTLAKSPITPDEIKQYFEENKARYETPKRLRLWRIEVADEATAKDIIAQSKGADGPKRWADLAREKSLDKATSQRGGELGFVRADGSTDVPRVQVDAAIFAAADKVTDGTIVPQPIKEGDHFSVIWRRGSVEAVKRTVEDETPSIRQILERRRVDKARQDLMTELKQKQVTDQHPELLANIDPQLFAPARRDHEPGPRRPHREGGPRHAPDDEKP